jgi:calcineurin-like phosphoesterase family protein
MIYFTSDLHLDHANVIKFCDRPFAHVDQMNSALIKNWNGIVAPNDDVWVNGDFCFGDFDKWQMYCNMLKGNKFLIRGNHDRLQDGQIIKAGFSAVYDLHVLKHNHQKYVLCHYAMRTWPSSHKGSFHLYGHSHGDIPDYGLSFDVGVDANDFKPVSIDQVDQRMLVKIKEGACATNHHV